MGKNLTYQEVKEYIEGDEGNSCKLLSEKYINNKTKLEIRCKCGNKFETEYKTFKHMKQRQCTECGFESSLKKRTKDPFLFEEEVYELVKEEYSVVGKYVNGYTKIKIKHSVCNNVYEVRPKNFIRGDRCAYCSGKIQKNTQQYKKEVFDLVGDEYTVLEDYKNANKKIEMKHNKCGYLYKIAPSSFLQNKRCPICAGNKTPKSDIQFREEVFLLVGKEYELLNDYKNAKTKVKVKHVECGYVYETFPSSFSRGYGCPSCSSSKGNRRIEKELIKRNLNHKSELSFDNLLYVNKLRFDFAVFNSKNNLICLIEYDGKQHFEPIKYFGGISTFKEQKIKDNLKDQYCKDNNIPLIRIAYYHFDYIEDILSYELTKLKLIYK